MINALKEIIRSDDFKANLNTINKNYFNLKHEIFIRNQLITQFNARDESNEVALAEHPKFKRGVAFDLSLSKKDGEIKNRIEFKYQYPKDLNYKAARNSLLKDTNEYKGTVRCTNFILIVHERCGESMQTYSSGGTTPIYIERNCSFSAKTYKNLSVFENDINREYDREVISVKTCEPYPNTYHFICYDFK